MADLNKDSFTNNILDILTQPRTPSEPQNKEDLEKINEQMQSITGNLNNKNAALQKALILLAMTQGQVEGLPLKAEMKAELDHIIQSNTSTVTLGNKAAMYVSALLGQAVSTDKTLYAAIQAGLNNNLGPLYEKINEIKLTHKLGERATTNLNAAPKNDSPENEPSSPTLKR